MQLYRGMDIGTAKLPPGERRGIPHHLIDVLDVTDEATVAAYQRDARSAIEQILARGATAVLVGGSGLYVSSVLYDLRFPGTDPVVRERWEREAAERGPGFLYRTLYELDDVAARAIGPANTRRLVRALEVIEITGEPHRARLPETPVPWRHAHIFGLRAPRDELTRRLDERVERMWESGLVDEVEGLIPLGLESGVTASRAIGYAQALSQIAGRKTRAEAIAETQQLTRRYARRQVSWFGRYRDVTWLDHRDPTAAVRVAASMGSDPAPGSGPRSSVDRL
jgi:tRNA dimethylallyltransferase